MVDQRATRWLEITVVAAVCAFLFFYGLGSFGLLGADEPRYAQIGGEMLARHDWIVPVLNGAPWLEKPPLLYWGEMASYSVFGVHDWAARVPVGLITVAMVLALYGFVRRHWPGWQMHAALITASLAAVVGFGRGATTDMPLTACFVIAMMAWWEWHEGNGRRWLLAFYFFSALGMLAKGPVAPFLAGALVVAFAAAQRDGKLIARTLWWPGVLLFLVVSVPWYIAIQLRTGDFFRVFILEHNLARFGTDLYRHKQPFWYYLLVLLALMMPWSVVFLAAVVEAARKVFPRQSAVVSDRPARLFLLLWLVVPVIFFSLSQSKLPGYILPSIPAGALLVISYLSERQGRLPAGLVVLQAACCGGLVAAVLLSPHLLLRLRPPAAAIATAALAGALVFALVSAAMILRGIRVAHVVTLIPVLLSVAFVVKVSAPMLDATQSARQVAEMVRKTRPAGMPVVVYRVPRQTEYGLPFYGIPVTVAGDLSTGPDLSDGNYFLIAREGSFTAIGSGAIFGAAGTFPAQRLVFYFVAPATHRQ